MEQYKIQLLTTNEKYDDKAVDPTNNLKNQIQSYKIEIDELRR